MDFTAIFIMFILFCLVASCFEEEPKKNRRKRRQSWNNRYCSNSESWDRYNRTGTWSIFK